ncbi:MAG: hypothetical protein IKO41_04120 [Lachnospiraceae bacterium]|nr:hypothetical protein [Lachnospiraceae bacterium]
MSTENLNNNDFKENAQQKSVYEMIEYLPFDATDLHKSVEEFFKDYDFSKMISRNSDITSDIHYAF